MRAAWLLSWKPFFRLPSVVTEAEAASRTPTGGGASSSPALATAWLRPPPPRIWGGWSQCLGFWGDPLFRKLEQGTCDSPQAALACLCYLLCLICFLLEFLALEWVWVSQEIGVMRWWVLGGRDSLGSLQDTCVGGILTSDCLVSIFLTKGGLTQTSLCASRPPASQHPPFNIPALTLQPCVVCSLKSQRSQVPWSLPFLLPPL